MECDYSKYNSTEMIGRELTTQHSDNVTAFS